MPTFGFWELTLVMFVALLVVGPDRLPRLAAQAGRWIGRVKRLATSFKEDLAQELHTEDLKNTIAAPREEVEKLGRELKQTGSQVEREVRRLDPLVKAMDDQVESGRFEPGDDDDDDRGASGNTDGKRDEST